MAMSYASLRLVLPGILMPSTPRQCSMAPFDQFQSLPHFVANTNFAYIVPGPTKTLPATL